MIVVPSAPPLWQPPPSPQLSPVTKNRVSQRDGGRRSENKWSSSLSVFTEQGIPQGQRRFTIVFLCLCNTTDAFYGRYVQFHGISISLMSSVVFFLPSFIVFYFPFPLLCCRVSIGSHSLSIFFDIWLFFTFSSFYSSLCLYDIYTFLPNTVTSPVIPVFQEPSPFVLVRNYFGRDYIFMLFS